MERVEGRLVLDVLRHALTACSLASFSLADCAQSLLARAWRPAPARARTRLTGPRRDCGCATCQP